MTINVIPFHSGFIALYNPKQNWAQLVPVTRGSKPYELLIRALLHDVPITHIHNLQVLTPTNGKKWSSEDEVISCLDSNNYTTNTITNFSILFESSNPTKHYKKTITGLGLSHLLQKEH